MGERFVLISVRITTKMRSEKMAGRAKSAGINGRRCTGETSECKGKDDGVQRCNRESANASAKTSEGISRGELRAQVGKRTQGGEKQDGEEIRPDICPHRNATCTLGKGREDWN